MRELKFRVWDKRYKRYVKPYAVCLDGRAIAITEPSNDLETLDSERAIIEQYTGLKDSNGKKIYEGDIVKYSDGDAYEVCFFNGCFGIKNRNLSALYSSYTFNDHDIYSSTGKLRLEVIGNIHGNKDLSEEEDVRN